MALRNAEQTTNAKSHRHKTGAHRSGGQVDDTAGCGCRIPCGSASCVLLDEGSGRESEAGRKTRSVGQWSWQRRIFLLASSTCCLMVIVGSGGCDREPPLIPRGLKSSWGLCAQRCLRQAGEGSAGREGAIHGAHCAKALKDSSGLRYLCVPQVLRPRGGSDNHRSVSLERQAGAQGQRGPPAQRHEDVRRGDGGYRGDRGDGRDRADPRADRRDDRRLRQEVGDKCIEILRVLGGVTDLPRLVERWSGLYPRNVVSRDGQVVL